jgi:hypothetical protein
VAEGSMEMYIYRKKSIRKTKEMLEDDSVAVQALNCLNGWR